MSLLAFTKSLINHKKIMKRTEPVSVIPLNAVTATTTSNAVDIRGAKKVSFIFTRANHSSGSSKFEALCSADGTLYAAGMLIKTIAADAGAGTAGEDIDYTRALSATLAANGSEVWALDLKHFTYKEVKVKVTETTDGTHTCKMLIEY